MIIARIVMIRMSPIKKRISPTKVFHVAGSSFLYPTIVQMRHEAGSHMSSQSTIAQYTSNNPNVKYSKHTHLPLYF